MKVRFTINEDGELEGRDGVVLGRITSLTIETAGGGRGRGVEVKGVKGVPLKGNTSVNGERQEETTTFQNGAKVPSPISPEITEIWEHYVSVFGATRMALNSRRQKLIEQALKNCGIEEIKLAISGLRVSPWHNGENPGGKKYLAIRYALKGNGDKGESDDERIDRMASFASSQPAKLRLKDRGVLNGRIEQLQADIRRGYRRDPRMPEPTEEQLQARAEAIAKLAKLGIKTTIAPDGSPSYEDAT